jgi:hypothetical protein
MADEIEWGTTPAAAAAVAPVERRGWLGRLTGRAPERTPARSRINPVALGLTIVAFVAVLAAQYLPWMHVDLQGTTDPGVVGVDQGSAEQGSRAYDFSIGVINSWQNVAYELGVVFCLALIATLLVTAGPVRRVLTATTLGLLAGQLTVLVGIGTAIDQGAVLGNAIQVSEVADDNIGVGTGFVLALAACVLLAAAAVVNLRTAHPARTKDRPAGAAAADEPLDLVVTPLPAETVDIRSEHA